MQEEMKVVWGKGDRREGEHMLAEDHTLQPPGGKRKVTQMKGNQGA